ncbi:MULTISPECIES: type IV secretion system protein [unclassified Bartonella]|uniref:type IV secretion system protein n=1 Tax=unclassified Bartonella TaxID=2645622 RepID=UPI0035CF4FD7
MRKIFIITGMIIAFGLPNLAYSFVTSIPNPEVIHDSYTSASKKTAKPPAEKPPAEKPLSTSAKEYLKIIELLKEQVEAQKKRISKDADIYHSVMGNRVINRLMSPNNMDYFFQNPELIYPVPKLRYNNKDTMSQKLMNIIAGVIMKEKRPHMLPNDQIRTMVNERLKYSGIVSKAVSLRAFQDAKKRFIQITNFLNDIDKTRSLSEVAELQVYIKIMLALLHNESLKLQMIRNLSNNEEFLIDIQKRKIYGNIVNTLNRQMPRIRFYQNSL